MKDDGASTVTVVGFGRRLAATLIDAVFVWVMGLLLGTAVGVAGLLLDMFTPNRPAPLDALIVASGLVFSVAYFVAAWARSGQTIGKMFLGIKVVGSDGAPLSWGAAVLRYIGYIVNALVLSLGFLWIVFDAKRQGWHDKIARSYVVYEDAEFPKDEAVKLVPEDRRRRWIWIVAWIFVALSMPAALLSTVWIVGPYVGQLVATFVGNLR